MTTTIITVIAISWICGCAVGIGIGGNLDKWKTKRDNEQNFVEKHRRVG